MNKALWEFATLLLKMFFVLFLKAIFSKDFACVEAENLGAFLGGICFVCFTVVAPGAKKAVDTLVH